MKRYRSFKHRIIAVFLVVMVFSVFLPFTAAETEAADSATKTVRVAAEESGLFITLDKDGKPVSGYAYEYIETIAAYSGWDVEYIMRPGFSECYQMVMDGTAD